MEETDALGTAAPSPDTAATPQSLEAVVENWWADHFPGSPVAQVTAAWNHAFAAKEELKRRLANLVEGH
jgi:hypothetical protein